MISFESKGDFKNTERFLDRMSKGDLFRSLNKYGQMGVRALASATPSESGATAAAWSYTAEVTNKSYSLKWHNGNIVGGTPLVILLQYGHGTGTGGYVSGRDFINPAIKPIFDQISEEVWKVVTRA